MAMFTGVGMYHGRSFLRFLNSHGAGFGPKGFVRTFFDQIYQNQFYTLEVDEKGAKIADADSGPAPPLCGSPPSVLVDQLLEEMVTTQLSAADYAVLLLPIRGSYIIFSFARKTAVRKALRAGVLYVVESLICLDI